MRQAGTRRGGPEATRERLVQAGERLFARHGVDRVRLREINELAGQRNSSALHYHFGSRQGLVLEILRRHEEDIEAETERLLDQWEQQGLEPDVRDIAAAMIRPLAGKLDSPSGRDFLRIVPHVVPGLSATLRQGHPQPLTAQSQRVLRLFEARIGHLPREIRRERLVVYMLMLTAVLAERAQQLESGLPSVVSHEQFVVNLLDMVEGIFTVPSQVSRSRSQATAGLPGRAVASTRTQ